MKRYHRKTNVAQASVSSYFKLSVLTAAMLGVMMPATHAEEVKGIEEVVVTGIRGSLNRAMDIKRNESGVVDAISAEDIGKFADANLAESLQRITGVSIDRVSGEGNNITVRGLGPNFNLVTLNGRQMPTANSPELESIASATQSRAFNFNQIASEGVSGVSLYKTSRPDLPTGGLGATVDIRTAKPFDFDGTAIVTSLSAIHDSSVEDGDNFTSEFGGLFSTILLDGTVGVLFNFDVSERDFSESSAHTDGWLRDNPDNDPDSTVPYDIYCETIDCNDVPFIYRPVSNIGEIQHNERKRTNAQFVVQYAPNEDLEFTLDYTLSRFENKQERFQTGLFGVVGAPVTNVVLSENNSLLHATRGAAAADAIFYKNKLNIENDSLGFNVKWQVNDTLRLKFDAHSSTAESQPGNELSDVTQIAQGPLGNIFDLTYSSRGVDIIVDDSGAFRGDQQFGGGDPVANVDGFQSPAGFSPLGTVLRNIAIENTVDQYQFQADWDFDTVQVTAGVSWIDYEVETNALLTGFQFQGLVPCPTCADFIPAPSSSGAPSAFQTVNEISIDALVAGTFPTPNQVFLDNTPPTFFGASEESLALYFNVSNEFELAGRPARISAGLRYETTDVEGSAFKTFPQDLRIVSDTEGVVFFDPDTSPTSFTIEEDYTVFLPSVDFQVEPFEDHIARASYGRSIARPDLNGLRPITTVSDYRPGRATASKGNPALQPYISDNFDLSYEWYYAEGSYLSAAFFFKQIDDYIITEVETDVLLDINGNPLLNPEGRFVPVPQTQEAVTVISQPGDPEAQFEVSRLRNTQEREVKGLELSVQHLFGDTGFGIQANYTVVEADFDFDPNNFDEQAILLGLSDSANLIGFFENGKLSVRVAANWRDEFLFAENQLRATNEPVFTEEYIQWDLSSSYNINDNLSVSFEILNIFGEDVVQHGRYSEQFLYENTQDARYTLGIRATF